MRKLIIIGVIALLFYLWWKNKQQTQAEPVQGQQTKPGTLEEYANKVISDIKNAASQAEPSLVDPVAATNANIAALQGEPAQQPVIQSVIQSVLQPVTNQVPAAYQQIIAFLSRPQDPVGQQRLILQLRTPDSMPFTVGSKVRLQGSKLYTGIYNIWYDYSGVHPVYGPVRNIYLDTIFKGSEQNVTVIKA